MPVWPSIGLHRRKHLDMPFGPGALTYAWDQTSELERSIARRLSEQGTPFTVQDDTELVACHEAVALRYVETRTAPPKLGERQWLLQLSDAADLDRYGCRGTSEVVAVLATSQTRLRSMG